MAGVPMADEFYERYRHLSQRELYHLLMAGSPVQVSNVAGAWRAAGDAIESVVKSLRANLALLLPEWRSAGSREFEFRMNLVVAFAEKLATEAAAIRNGLTVMGEALEETQRRVEPDRPEHTEAAAATTGLALGHVQSAEEQAKARERVAVLVARLAAEYAVTDHRSWPASIPAPPGLIGESAVEVAPSEMEATEAKPPAGTMLAGAGGFGAGGVASVGAVSTPAAPLATLGGASPGLAAVAGVAATSAARSEGTGRTTTGAVGGPMPMMMGGAGMAGGRVGDGGYAVVDPRLGDDAWSTGDTVSWDGGDGDAPPAILDGRDPASRSAQR
jgi:hypothetical protein